MTLRPTLRFATVLLALLSVALFVFALINFQQRSLFQLPDDGVSWVDSAGGVKAWIVDPNGAGSRGGVKEGDTLIAIQGIPIDRAAQAVHEVFRRGVGATLFTVANPSNSSARI